LGGNGQADIERGSSAKTLPGKTRKAGELYRLREGGLLQRRFQVSAPLLRSAAVIGMVDWQPLKLSHPEASILASMQFKSHIISRGSAAQPKQEH